MSPLPERQPVPEEITARLASKGIWQMANGSYYGVFVREGCLAVAMRDAGSGTYVSLREAGITLEAGLSYLVWREERAFFAPRGEEGVPATPEQIETLRQFTDDVEIALGLKLPADPCEQLSLF